MCIYEGHRCISVPNMKFLSSNLWLGGVCTDDAKEDVNDDDDGQSMIV